MINEQIRDREVRLISDTGEQLGIVSLSDAMGKAEQLGLDLVKISPNAKPPVCKIMDYGKHKFDLNKKQKEARKRQRENAVKLKGMNLPLLSGQHDIDFKAKKVKGFLEDGDKVKVSMMFKGRLAYDPESTKRGIEVMKKFAESLKEFCVIETRPKREGRFINMIIVPIDLKTKK